MQIPHNADTDSNVKLDLNYLIKEMEALNLPLPEECRKDAPKALRVFAKKKKMIKKDFP